MSEREADTRVPEEAVQAAAEAYRTASNYPIVPANHTDALRAALEAAAPFLKAGEAEAEAGVMHPEAPLAAATGEAVARNDVPQFPTGLHILFDGPPSHESGRFVEVETPDGKSVNAGEWRERGDKLWELRIPGPIGRITP